MLKLITCYVFTCASLPVICRSLTFATLETEELKQSMACFGVVQAVTSPNLSFREFLTRMNSAQQMKRAEHSLNQIDGSTFVASKKKWKTFAQCSKEGGHAEIYELAETYEAFLLDLETACHQGDRDSKAAIEHFNTTYF